MSTQLRGRRSGPFWSILFLLTIVALALGYFVGAQQKGVPWLLPSPTWTPILTAQPTTLPATSGIGNNPRLIVVPELVAPEPNYTIFANIETTFAWQWSGTLVSNQGFEILFWPQGQPGDKRGIHDVRETQNMMPEPDGIYRLSKIIQNQGEGNYEWTVAVVQLDDYQRLVEASPRLIKISLPIPNSGSRNDNAASTRTP